MRISGIHYGCANTSCDAVLCVPVGLRNVLHRRKLMSEHPIFCLVHVCVGSLDG